MLRARALTGGLHGIDHTEWEEAMQRRGWRKTILGVVGAGILPVLGLATLAGPSGAQNGPTEGSAAAPAGAGTAAPTSCRLGNGVQHVVEITFDNVHFFRDNPNVPSDLELMPNLLNFFENNGSFLSNNHTPLIAHTANDIVTTLTGLYGDRQGITVGANNYRSYNSDGTTDPASSFAYWTDPIFDTAKTPNAGHDTNPNLVYSSTPPATSTTPPSPTTVTPAPWVPFTRAGCNVGGVSTANIELENNSVDLTKVFGAGSPEVQQLAADPDSFKDAETADYDGVAVHCARQNAVCTSAQGVKFGQTAPTATASPDVLRNEPGGYSGYEALYGHRYVAPQLGAGTPNLMHNGYQVTNAAGNLVDLNGNQINGAFLSDYPGFPGFGSINAAQSLAYVADMQESGVPVTYGYVSDIHGNEHIPGLSGCTNAPSALGSGTPCYLAQAAYYNAAFGTFFQRLAADGITPQNSLFILSSDEGDHEVGANVGRAMQPTPANCDGVTIPCTYPAGSFGELSGNLTGLLATEKGDTTPLDVAADSAPELYVTGNPAPGTPGVRQLEHDVAGLTANNPYSGNASETIANYLADPTEEAILHMVDADPARTPTLTMFAKPDYFLSSGSTTCPTTGCVSVNSGFAWDHGDDAAEINTNYLGLAGPGVAHLGLDGTAADAGPSSAGADSGQVTVPGSGTTGTWTDETDIRPTLMYLTGLKDDYEHDGRVITEVLSHANPALSAPGVDQLGTCYKQLESSVGVFGTNTLVASTNGIESTSQNDGTYKSTEKTLAVLDQLRDAVGGQIKLSLDAAAFSDHSVSHSGILNAFCQGLLQTSSELAH